MIKLILESQNAILKLTADEVDRIKGVTEYGGDYKQLNYKLTYGKPKRLIIRDINTLDLISYIVEEEKDNIEKSINAKLKIAYREISER